MNDFSHYKDGKELLEDLKSQIETALLMYDTMKKATPEDRRMHNSKWGNDVILLGDFLIAPRSSNLSENSVRHWEKNFWNGFGLK